MKKILLVLFLGFPLSGVFQHAAALSVAILDAPAEVSTSAPFEVSVVFSENVTGFISDDVLVVNSSITSFIPVDGKTFAVEITPDGGGDISIDVAAGVALDAALIGNTAAIPVNVIFDTIAPIADAGTDQSVSEGDAVDLDGTGSMDDVNGSVEGYAWTQVDSSGIAVTLTGADTATPSFTAPEITFTITPTVLTFSLVVTDNFGGSSEADTVNVTVNNVNLPPTANAGNDQFVDESDVVALDGSASIDSDSDGSVAGYSWTQTDLTGFVVLLTGADTATPSFTAPEITFTISPTVLTFSLVVTDNEGGTSEADTVSVTVNNVNVPPTANAGNNRFVDESSIVMLDGSSSVDDDSDGSVDSYLWTQTSGVEVFLDDETSVTPSFDPPYVNSNEALEFTLVVTDNEDAESTEDMVTITVTNVAVDAGVDQQATEGDSVGLNGINSLAINGDISRYRWTQLEGPPVALDNRDNAMPSFVAPEVAATTLLVFELEVVDGRGARDYDTVLINLRDELLTSTAPPLDVQLLDKSVAGGALYQFNTTGVFGPAVLWNQVNGPVVTLDSANSETPSFTAPTVPTDSSAVFEVRSTDLDGRVVRAAVNVNILESLSTNVVPVAHAGEDQEVTESDTVFLDAASESRDPDGSIVGYQWQQTSGPMVAFSSIINSRPTFLSPAIAALDSPVTLTFEVLVIDNNGFVDRDSVTVTVTDNGITGFADDVATIVSSTGDSIGVETGSGSNLIGLESVDPTTIVDDVNRPAFLAYGLIDFGLRVVPGDRAQISFTLPEPAPADFTWWKYSTTDGWRNFGASFNATRDVVTISITDNARGDDDPAPGIIRDPGGLGPTPPMEDTTEPNPAADSSGGGGSGSAGPWLLLFLLFSALIAISRSNRQIRQQWR